MASERAMKLARQWEHQAQHTFFAPVVPGKAINWIDEVVEWAKTAHGGRQLRIIQPPNNCESKYGLCE
jgi:hypothetical protein